VKPLTRARWLRTIAVFLLLWLGVQVGGALVGPQPIDLGRALSGATGPDRDILFAIRVPRDLLAALVGGARAVSGVVFQAVLRNPLASPYVLGVSAGGTLGAVLVIHLGLARALPGVPTIPAAAFLGCLLSIALVFAIARQAGMAPRHTLLLSGVIVNACFSAVVLFITYVASPEDTVRIVRWLMGGIGWEPYSTIAGVAAVLVPGAALTLRFAGSLNLLSLGEEGARSLGVPVERTRNLLFLLVSLLTGISVAVTGPIGFVGLIVPHLLRLVLGPDHRVLLPVAFLAGGAFLTLADSLARTLLSWTSAQPREIPVGVLTALLGGPFFVLLLRRHFQRSYFD
jgi:iron complex transport system permease protein